MTARTYATWVAPLAQEFDENRRAVLDFARARPAQSWEQPAPLDGWTYKDILAHLAAGNDKQFQRLLRAVINRTPVDPGWFGDSDAQNARNVDERRERSVGELIAELEQDGEDCLDLIAQLTDKHGTLGKGNFDMSFSEAVPGFTRHDLEHLEQLRTASQGQQR